MDELLNEHEQGERVRSWLQRNAAGLLGGIVLGLALIWGWGQWQDRRSADRDAVAGEYDRFEQAVAQNPETAAAQISGKLAGTPYAALAALELAKAHVDAGKETEALAVLTAARSDDPMLARILRQRTATLMTATGKPADAVALLGKPDDAASLQVLGDAQLALGKAADAQQSYRQALRTLEEGSPERQVVELKLAEAGGQTATP